VTSKSILATAGLLGALGVGLGAFGAHGLKGMLVERGTFEIWQTAVLYHLVHLTAFAFLLVRVETARWNYRLFLGGVILFSGSLYLYALLEVKFLAMVTPVGGVLLLGGWLLLFWRAVRS
jgi:uncharacterized membrane protein YgdD (TMEM256/DUF423 family)